MAKSAKKGDSKKKSPKKSVAKKKVATKAKPKATSKAKPKSKPKAVAKPKPVSKKKAAPKTKKGNKVTKAVKDAKEAQVITNDNVDSIIGKMTNAAPDTPPPPTPAPPVSEPVSQSPIDMDAQKAKELASTNFQSTMTNNVHASPQMGQLGDSGVQPKEEVVVERNIEAEINAYGDSIVHHLNNSIGARLHGGVPMSEVNNIIASASTEFEYELKNDGGGSYLIIKKGTISKRFPKNETAYLPII
jgi:hypothetical protein